MVDTGMNIGWYRHKYEYRMVQTQVYIGWYRHSYEHRMVQTTGMCRG